MDNDFQYILKIIFKNLKLILLFWIFSFGLLAFYAKSRLNAVNAKTYDGLYFEFVMLPKTLRNEMGLEIDKVNRNYLNMIMNGKKIYPEGMRGRSRHASGDYFIYQVWVEKKEEFQSKFNGLKDNIKKNIFNDYKYLLIKYDEETGDGARLAGKKNILEKVFFVGFGFFLMGIFMAYAKEQILQIRSKS